MLKPAEAKQARLPLSLADPVPSWAWPPCRPGSVVPTLGLPHLGLLAGPCCPVMSPCSAGARTATWQPEHHLCLWPQCCLSKRVKWDFLDILETNCESRLMLKCTWQVHRWLGGFSCVLDCSANPWAGPPLALSRNRSLPRAVGGGLWRKRHAWDIWHPHMFCVSLMRRWVMLFAVIHVLMHPPEHTHTHTHRRVSNYRPPSTDHMLIFMPAEAAYSNTHLVMWQFFCVHIRRTHSPWSRSVISSLTTPNVMSHWTKFCGSVNYGPVSAALSMATWSSACHCMRDEGIKTFSHYAATPASLFLLKTGPQRPGQPIC